MAEPVFELVKSLTKHEKIFFKRYAEIHGKKEPNYIKLFNAMDSMKEYDEAKLRKKLKKFPWAKRLPYERLYLKNALLESLRAFSANEKSGDPAALIETQVRRELDYIAILRKKSAPELALKMVNKIIDDATK